LRPRTLIWVGLEDGADVTAEELADAVRRSGYLPVAIEIEPAPRSE